MKKSHHCQIFMHEKSIFIPENEQNVLISVYELKRLYRQIAEYQTQIQYYQSVLKQHDHLCGTKATRQLDCE